MVSKIKDFCEKICLRTSPLGILVFFFLSIIPVLSDNLLDLFKFRFYSDIIGLQKPNTFAINKIRTQEKIDNDQIIHIGDLLNKDYELSRKSGCYFILLDHYKKYNSSEINLRDEQFLGICHSYTELELLLKRLIIEKNNFNSSHLN